MPSNNPESRLVLLCIVLGALSSRQRGLGSVMPESSAPGCGSPRCSSWGSWGCRRRARSVALGARVFGSAVGPLPHGRGSDGARSVALGARIFRSALGPLPHGRGSDGARSIARGARFRGRTITTGSRPWLLSCRPGRGCFPDKIAMLEPRIGQFEKLETRRRARRGRTGWGRFWGLGRRRVVVGGPGGWPGPGPIRPTGGLGGWRGVR